MRALKISTYSLLGVLVVGLIVIAGSWAAFGRPSKGVVAPHVSLAGRRVDGLNQARLSAAVDDLATQYATTSIEVSAGDQYFVTPTNSFGLSLDKPATTAAAMHVGRQGFFVTQMYEWVRDLAHPAAVSIKVSADSASVDASVAKLDPTNRMEPTEPTIAYVDGKVSAVDGQDGHGLRGTDVRQGLNKAATKGLPLQVTVKPGTLQPRFTRADAQRLADQANSTLPVFDLIAGSAKTTVQNQTLRPWLTARPTAAGLQLVVNPDAATKDLPTLLPNAGTAPVEPQYVVDNHQPKWQLGKDGTACCDLTSGVALATAVDPRLVSPSAASAVPTDAAPVTLPLVVSHPTNTATEAPFAGIKEQVGAFTTHYPAGQPRVTNIHRIADTVRSQVIQPGGTFSLNDTVGPRTVEKGYVADHAISDSEYVEQIGGGISQFSTTLFNAAFFSGLEWTEYQSHSIYISRYPYGREATISYPKPDQKIKNTTPYPILIWTSYDGTSVTVEMYSTKYVDAVQSGQSEQPMAHDCKRVKTDRTRTYLDGHTVVDSVYAVYQPKEGVNCWAP